MKKVLLIAAAAVVATVGTVGLAGPAQAAQYIADGDECTRTEYSRIERGMSKDRVARIIGTSGHLEARQYPYTLRSYGGKKVGTMQDKVTWASECDLIFEGNYVVRKSGFYGRI